MSITDELRDCIRTANRSYEDARNPYNDRETLHVPEEELTAIADRIDAEHEKECSRSWMRGHDVWASVGNDGVMAERGWVRLPVDADGVPIRIGDLMEADGDVFNVLSMELFCDGSWSIRNDVGNGFEYWELHHVKPDSWESIIEDALTIGWQNGNWNEVASADIHDKLVERCRRLAGEAE